MKTRNYQSLVTSLYKDKENFNKTLNISTNAYTTLQNLTYDLIKNLSIDEAIGVQLDFVGEWIGRTRHLKQPLDNVYFAFDTTKEVGWDLGVWHNKFDPSESMISLDDDSYRYLLYLQATANSWNGTKQNAYDKFRQVFKGNKHVLIVDNQDMSIDIYFSGYLPSTIKALLKAREQPFKPESVRVNTYFSSDEDGAIFAFDIDNEALNGWDLANFADPI